ncbi:hypothetical protein ANN_14064 [Periplaneta americana]|uniref:Uncharacterized protein n=1 Tax=Periplaneta americana TaxID=6978 RepID=A0ABQ8SWP6_PERAM|nr:hypothetical protein ANN_14064 [Periplaneta americana]
MSPAMASWSKASCLGLALRNARWFESSWEKKFSHEISASVWDWCPPSIVMHLGSYDSRDTISRPAGGGQGRRWFGAANEVARASASWGMCCGVERRGETATAAGRGHNAPVPEGRNPENSRGAIFWTSVEISSIVLSGNYDLVIKEETQVNWSSCYSRWTASQPVLCSSEASFETGVRLECVRSCVSVRSPEFECSAPQLGDLSSKFSGLSLKVWGSRYCELE